MDIKRRLFAGVPFYSCTVRHMMYRAQTAIGIRKMEIFFIALIDLIPGKAKSKRKVRTSLSCMKGLTKA